MARLAKTRINIDGCPFLYSQWWPYLAPARHSWLPGSDGAVPAWQ